MKDIHFDRRFLPDNAHTLDIASSEIACRLFLTDFAIADVSLSSSNPIKWSARRRGRWEVSAMEMWAKNDRHTEGMVVEDLMKVGHGG